MHWQIPTITVTFWKTLIRRDYSTFMRRRWHLTWLFSWRAPYKNIHTVLDVLDLYVNTQCTGNAKYQVAAFKHVAQWNQKTHMGFCLWNYWVQAFQNVTQTVYLSPSLAFAMRIMISKAMMSPWAMQTFLRSAWCSVIGLSHDSFDVFQINGAAAAGRASKWSDAPLYSDVTASGIVTVMRPPAFKLLDTATVANIVVSRFH